MDPNVSPLGSHSPNVEIVEGDGCSSCIFVKALTYLLKHSTGTGKLILTAEELAEIGEPELTLLLIRKREKKNA